MPAPAPTLADLTTRTGLDVLGHLERQVTVPVSGGLQAQGDLLVIPVDAVPRVGLWSPGPWRDVPAAGIELLRSAGGGNPHTLVADAGTCSWTTAVRDPVRLALGQLRCTAPVYLIHPEHGGTGIAPGTYVIRRQRERSDRVGRYANRLVAD
ncbi:hypothetical protein HOY81_19640 [Streptomyces sp. JJ36]|nr:hypothetical protein [Streptomyces sp. JJ36]